MTERRLAITLTPRVIHLGLCVPMDGLFEGNKAEITSELPEG